MVQATVRRIRDYAHASWAAALTPIFAPDGESFDGTTYRSQVGPFVALIRGLAEQRAKRKR